MRLIARLATVAGLVLLLAPTTALRAPTIPPLTPATENGCAKCTDFFRGTAQMGYSAGWSLSGNCEPESACAICEPMCTATGNFNGGWASTQDWYNDNSCAAWSCWELSADNLESLASADAATLAGAVRQSTERVQFNEERGAIQVYDCSGVVRAHLPLGDIRAAELAALMKEIPGSRAITGG